MGSQQIQCPDCDYKYVIAKSKRSNPCPNCLHFNKTGMYLLDAKKKKQHEQQIQSKKRAQEKMKLKPAKEYAIPKFSKKGKVQANRVAAMKIELKQQAAEGEFTKCEGCGQYKKGLDASHKVPLSQSIMLADEPSNIRLLCRDCHNIWEHGTVEELINLYCFTEDMEFLFDNDRERYWKIYFRIGDYAKQNPSKELTRIINEITFDDE